MARESTATKVTRHTLRLFLPKPVAKQRDLSGQSIVVTGAAPGSIGYHTVLCLAHWGAKVVATSLQNVAELEVSLARDLQGLSTESDQVLVRKLDLCNSNDVFEFQVWFESNMNARLDVLINNAGIHKNIFDKKTRSADSADGIEIHWRTNYLGTFHLTKVLLPSLLSNANEGRQTRVVNVASHLHDRVSNDVLFHEPKAYNSWDAYAASKLALVHHSFELHRRFHEHGVDSVALHPGSAYTNMTRPIQEPQGVFRKSIYRANDTLTRLVLLNAHYGAQTSIFCATEPELVGGAYYDRCARAEAASTTQENGVGRDLWNRTESWCMNLTKQSGIGS